MVWSSLGSDRLGWPRMVWLPSPAGGRTSLRASTCTAWPHRRSWLSRVAAVSGPRPWMRTVGPSVSSGSVTSVGASEAHVAGTSTRTRTPTWGANSQDSSAPRASAIAITSAGTSNEPCSQVSSTSKRSAWVSLVSTRMEIAPRAVRPAAACSSPLSRALRPLTGTSTMAGTLVAIIQPSSTLDWVVPAPRSSNSRVSASAATSIASGAWGASIEGQGGRPRSGAGEAAGDSGSATTSVDSAFWRLRAHQAAATTAAAPRATAPMAAADPTVSAPVAGPLLAHVVDGARRPASAADCASQRGVPVTGAGMWRLCCFKTTSKRKGALGLGSCTVGAGPGAARRAGGIQRESAPPWMRNLEACS